MGELVRDLLTDQKFFDVIFPRLPVKTLKQIKEHLKDYEIKESKSGRERGRSSDKSGRKRRTVGSIDRGSSTRQNEKDRRSPSPRERKRSRSPDGDKKDSGKRQKRSRSPSHRNTSPKVSGKEKARSKANLEKLKAFYESKEETHGNDSPKKSVTEAESFTIG